VILLVLGLAWVRITEFHCTRNVLYLRVLLVGGRMNTAGTLVACSFLCFLFFLIFCYLM
jgi:hypothetical protein